MVDPEATVPEGEPLARFTGWAFIDGQVTYELYPACIVLRLAGGVIPIRLQLVASPAKRHKERWDWFMVGLIAIGYAAFLDTVFLIGDANAFRHWWMIGTNLLSPVGLYLVLRYRKPYEWAEFQSVEGLALFAIPREGPDRDNWAPFVDAVEEQISKTGQTQSG
jgi:hypothetical protein